MLLLKINVRIERFAITCILKKYLYKRTLYTVVSLIFVDINYRGFNENQITVSRIRKLVANDTINTIC